MGDHDTTRMSVQASDGLWRRLVAALVARIPDWLTLKKIGNSKLLSYTIFVPLIGYMIIFNTKITEYTQLIFDKPAERMIEGAALSRGTERLIFLFFGLSALGFGSLLFRTRCESEIQAHDFENSFIEEELRFMSETSVQEKLGQINFMAFQDAIRGVSILHSQNKQLQLNRILSVMLDVNYKDESFSVLDFKSAYGRLFIAHDRDLHDNLVRDIFRSYFRLKNVTKLWSRISISILFAAGGVLLVIPSLELALDVVEVMRTHSLSARLFHLFTN